MRFPGFVGGSYRMRAITADGQRTINLYPDPDEMKTAKEAEIGALIGTPGIKLLLALGMSPNRGEYTSPNNGRIFVVAGNGFFEILSNGWTSVQLGTLNTNSGYVQMADNGQALFIVDGTDGYYYNFNEKIITPLPWSADTSYSVGQSISTSDGHVHTCTVAGISGANIPAFPTGYLATIVDGGVTWTTDIYVWQPSTAYAVGAILNVNGYQYMATVAGVTGAVIPVFPTGRFATVVDGGVTWQRTTNFTQVTDIGFLGSNIVCFQDGYFIFAEPGTNTVYCSNPYSLTFNPLNFTNLGSSSSPVLAITSLFRNLYIQTAVTTEIFYNAATSPGFPFARINGGVLQQGVGAQFSVVQTSNAMFWLGQDRSGNNVIFTTNSTTPQRISTFAIEQELEEYASTADAIAYAYQEAGHSFYVLNFPTAQKTWAYDISTGWWHERAWNNNGLQQMQRQIFHTFAAGIHIVGDWQNGNIYQMSQDIFSDNGIPIIRTRITPHLAKDMQRIFYSQLQVDIQAGVGLDGIQQGTDPQVMMRFSDDGGRTWSNEKMASFGMIGATKKRAIFRRMGQARDRVFRVDISDPVFVAIVGAEIMFEVGSA